MQEVIEKLETIEELWATIYEHCSANPTAYKPHLPSLTVDEVGESILTISAWGRRIATKRRASGAYKISKGLLVTSLGQLMATLQKLAAQQYNHFPQLLTQLNQALSALFPLTFLGDDKGERAGAHLNAQLASTYAETEKINRQLSELIEKGEKTKEAMLTAEECATKATTSASDAAEKQSKVMATLEMVQQHQGDSAELLSQAKQDAEIVHDFSDDVAALKESADRLEQNLKSIIEKSQEQQERIDEALPQATSAGLASAFAKRSEDVGKPMKAWLWGFAVSLVLMCGTVVAAFLLFKMGDNEDFLSAFVRRFAFASPWVWSAWFCARNYGHLARLQEVYAFKETASRAFEGYKKQMLEIGGEPDAESPGKVALVEELSLRMMKILSKDPLDVFDRKGADETPFHSIVEKFVARKKVSSDDDDA